MISLTLGIFALFAGIALLSLGILTLRASARAQHLSRGTRYGQGVDAALHERGAYTTHGMVDGDRDRLIPQRRKADSYYDSFL